MSKRIQAVVEKGLLRPTEPLDLPEGQEVEVDVRPLPAPTSPAERHARRMEALRQLQESMAELPDEWWEEFEVELNANRLTI